MKLNKSFADGVRSEVEEIEKNSNSEIVPVLLKSSNAYWQAHLRSAIIFSILFQGIYLLVFWKWTNSIELFLIIQILGLIFGFCITYIPFIKKMLLSRNEIEEEVIETAMSYFITQQVYDTAHRSGVLLFVSLFEKQIHIIADKMITQKFPNDYWDKLVQVFVQTIKGENDNKNSPRNERIEKAFLKVLELCGQEMIKNFPKQQDDTNKATATEQCIDQLKNDLITDISFKS